MASHEVAIDLEWLKCPPVYLWLLWKATIGTIWLVEFGCVLHVPLQDPCNFGTHKVLV